MSAEIWHEVADAERRARQVIEPAFNERYGALHYGAGVEEWAFIAMIAPAGFGYEREVKRYRKKDRTMEFRLKMDYDAFRSADAQGCERLTAAALRRSLELAAELRIPDFQLSRLQADFDALASERHWL